MQITILGVPLAKARARIVRRGNFSVAYDPQDKEKLKFKQMLSLALEYLGKAGDKQTLIDLSNLSSAEAFSLDVELHFPHTKSATKAKRKQIYRNSKPDGDNCYKFLTDAANGILYSDDSKIVKGSFVKKYSDNPRTVININPININEEIV